MVLAERGTCTTFWNAASPKCSWQMSLAAGRINSSQTVKGFLALAMWLVTKNNNLSTDTFDEEVAFNNCFHSSCWLFLSFEKTKIYLFLILVSFLHLFILFVYFWLCLFFVAVLRLSLVVASGGYSSLWYMGFSLQWLLLLWSTGSRCLGFSSCGTWAQ